jgi:hypothetical protein
MRQRGDHGPSKRLIGRSSGLTDDADFENTTGVSVQNRYGFQLAIFTIA